MPRVTALVLALLIVAPVQAEEASPTVGLGLRGGGGFEFYNHGPVAAWSGTGQALVSVYVTRYIAVGVLVQHHFLHDFDGICEGGCSEMEQVADLVVVFDLPIQNSDVWSFRVAAGTGYRHHTKERSGTMGYTWVNQGIDILRFDVAAEYAVNEWLRLGPWFTWGCGVFVSGEKVYNDGQTPTVTTDWGIPDLLSTQLGLSVGAVF